MKKILIIGDSLTAGNPGVGYADILCGMKGHYKIIVKGQGGDTLLGIHQRLLKLLYLHAPEILIIEAGTNDILLPWFKLRGGIWRKLSNRLEALGSIPTTDISSYQNIYSKVIHEAKRFTSTIIIANIACIGEDLSSELNLQRAIYNDAIRLTAENCNIHLANVGKAFDDILGSMHSPSTYLLNEYSNLYLDTLLSITDKTIDFVSRRRGLLLTIDGVHLNSRGAEVFAETIQKSLTSIDS